MTKRRDCLRAEVLLICCCVTVYLYLAYLASLHQQDTSSPPSLQEVQGTPHPPQDLCGTSEKWIVVRMSTTEGTDLSMVQDVRGWRLLILTPHASVPILHRCMNCLFISDPRELALDLGVVNDVSPDIQPILFTIRRGARWVYLTSQLHHLDQQVSSFQLTKSHGLLADSRGLFSLSSHFTATTSTVLKYRVGEWPKLSIQSHWRPERKVKAVSTACLSLPIGLSANVIGLTDLSNALFGYDAFWSLISVASNTSSFVWSLWKQRLLWETEGNLVIFPPKGCYNLSVSDVDRTEVDERSIVRLVNLLKAWKCDQSIFFNCVRALTKALWVDSFLTAIDVYHVNFWTETLSKLNYDEPFVHKSSKVTVDYQAMYNLAGSLTKTREDYQNPFKKVCSQANHTVELKTKPNMLDQIMLIVLLTSQDSYDVINHLNYIYSRYFAHIVYCGETKETFMKVTKKYKLPLNFIEISTDRGKYGFKCAAGVMQMGFKVSGYLHVSYDVLLNFKQVAKLPQNKPWYQNRVQKANISASKVPNLTPLDPVRREWWPWTSQYGAVALKSLWRRLKQYQSTSKGFLEFLQMIKRNAGNENMVYYEASDLFYVPSSLRTRYIYFARYFDREHVYHDITVPTILYGLNRAEDIVRMNGSFLWFKEKEEYMKFYRTNNHYLHPWDIKSCLSKPKDADFLCKVYIPRIK